MTTFTRRGDTTVIHIDLVPVPAGCGMAVAAGPRGWWVVPRLAVTTFTRGGHIAVVELDIPTVGIMAVRTLVGRLDVIPRFAGCIAAIVATETVSGAAPMVKARPIPGDRTMAIITLPICTDMTSCREGVAGLTTALDCRVIDGHGTPVKGSMAVVTGFGRCDVPGAFTLA